MHVEYMVLVSAYEEAHKQRFSETGKDDGRAEFKKLREEVDELLKGRRPFHWPLEFPEVFARGMEEERGFAAIVSNPPFQGGSKISAALGINYRDYLVEYLAQGKRGLADLCAYFFLRASKLVYANGMCGLLATNTIAQGDTREVGLDELETTGWMIPYAVSSRKWPGIASLEVALVWLRRGRWRGLYLLDEKPVDCITPFLTQLGVTLGMPYRLASNRSKSFEGSKVYNPGFILKPIEAQTLIAKDPRNQDVLYPYLNGEDLNSHHNQSPSRWVINFYDWPLERAETYADCIKIVQERVKPERDLNNNKNLREKWWLYERIRPTLYTTIAKMDRILVKAQVSKTWGWIFVTNGWVYDAKVRVFAFDKEMEFAVLQNTFHWEWSIQYGTTLRLDMSYTPTTNFETFPFPCELQSLETIGKLYYEYRQFIMLTRQEGLTKTYNRFHDPHEIAEDIVRLRELHKEMDEAVAWAYSWDDLELEHGFHETKQGLRYTISEEARREVLGRLLKLNHERYAEEVAMGLHEKGGKYKGNGKKNGKGNGTVGGKDIVGMETMTFQEQLF
jgi:hypothetical protein